MFIDFQGPSDVARACRSKKPFSKDSVMPGFYSPSLTSIDKCVGRTGIKEVEGQAKTTDPAMGSMSCYSLKNSNGEHMMELFDGNCNRMPWKEKLSIFFLIFSAELIM